MKKSAKGLLCVKKQNNTFVLYDQVTIEEEKEGELTVVYKDGKFYNPTTLTEIRNKLK